MRACAPPQQESVAQATLRIEVGQTIELDALVARMVELGYERVERVERKGEMSVRGGILDFFPLASANPYRVELFDVEVDSIRSFDVTDQRSIEKIQELTVTPCREIVVDRKRLQLAAQGAYELLQAQLEKMSDRQSKDRSLEGIGHDIERLREGQYFHGLFKYVSLLFPERQTPLDYMPKDSILVVDEPARSLETAKRL
ncbi:hypothetical protein LJK88_48425 [Paenibacillus sp. P26]|nr:hypothetical protein LJK88_48425 [Paenibacillus sp. P26]